jgi:hypothetical protein
MILSAELLTIYILDIVFLLFASIAFFYSVKISLYYDASLSTPRQYKLEKESYLAATIIKYLLGVKIPLFLFFIFTLDKLSAIIVGAMCGAGVIDATEFGTQLLVLKLLNLYLFGYWILLHSEDMKHEDMPYTRRKFILFIVIFFLFMIEIFLEYYTFSSIDPNEVVDCCGVIYSASSNSYMSYFLKLNPLYLVGIFYFIYILLFGSYYLKLKEIFSALNLLFLIIAIISLIAFFGTYIYELPTHKCPFCMLQHEYHYIGYFLYTMLFLGTFNGIVLSFISFKQQRVKELFNYSFLFTTIYVITVSLYPIIYYIKNGVWL